ncbi:hypothetical protein U1Q18_025559, partial [Sarracenia purpurea var. burkii]
NLVWMSPLVLFFVNNRASVEFLNDPLPRNLQLGGNWKVVERFQRQGIWDVPERDNLEPNNNILNEVLQQEETIEITPIVVEDPMTTPLRRDDVEVEIIRQSVVEDVNDDDLICADGDGLMGETADEEEDDFDTSVDVDS